MAFKQPVSVLVVIHARHSGRVLMLQRRDDPDFWQSVTGSLEAGEVPRQTAQREVWEETGIDVTQGDGELLDTGRMIDFEIFACYRHRYAPGTTHNREHWFMLTLAEECEVRLSEHLTFRWMAAAEAAAVTKSWSNRQAIEEFILI
ncbi:dihydroneopterin triphosphate diphosphatase [Enterobacteriaceae bacterium LUAb1]